MAKQARIETYMVHVRVGSQFEDVYVTASSPEQAVAKARIAATLKHRFATFTV